MNGSYRFFVQLHKNQEHIQKTMLGAIDDILHYYSAFKKMNLKPSSQGLKLTLISRC